MSGVAPPKAPAAGRTTANALATTGASVNVSNAAAPTELGQILRIASLSPLGADWGYALPEGWVSVAWWGAVGDGVTNDNAAFQAAVATGKHVYIPAGTIANPKHYLLSQAISVGTSQVIYCDGWSLPQPIGTSYTYEEINLPYIPTCILWANATAACFIQALFNSKIYGVLVVQHFNYPATSSTAFYQGAPTGTGPFNLRIHNCASCGTYYGIQVAQRSHWSEVAHCLFQASVGVNIYINIPSGYGALKWTDVRSFGGTRGFLVDSCDTSRINGLTINNVYTGVPFEISGRNGTCAHLNITNLIIEDPTMTGDTIIIGNSAYSYSVQDITLDCFHAYVHTPAFNRNFILGTNSKRVCMSDVHLRGYKYVDNGDSNILHGARIHTELAIAGSGTAVTLNGPNALVSDLRVKDFVNGLTFGAAGNYALLNNVNLRNNTNSLDATSDVAAKATGKGRGIMGLADWG